MARKIKVDNAILKRYAREEVQRKEAVRSIRVYYLIVCEGEKTEPNYFKGLKADLPRGVLEFLRIDIEGVGKNTRTLVEESLELKERYHLETGRPIDRLWVVFDRDSFPAADFNSAILKCRELRETIGCAWSNEAFELWYLLHFQLYPINDWFACVSDAPNPMEAGLFILVVVPSHKSITKSRL